MSLMSPHIERRLQAPIRQFARKNTEWRGVPSLKLAEQYASQRVAEQKLAAAVTRVNRTARLLRRNTGALTGPEWLSRLIGKLLENLAFPARRTAPKASSRSFRQRPSRQKHWRE